MPCEFLRLSLRLQNDISKRIYRLAVLPSYDLSLTPYDRVPQMVPDHSNSSKSEVVRYRCGLPQTASWPGGLRDPVPSFASFLDT